MAFPTTEDIKSYLRNEKPTEDDGLYGEAIAAAIQTLNDACQRNFTVATGVQSARTFVPDCGSATVYIGDAVSVTSVVENSVTLTVGSHYQLEPVGTVSAAGLTTPYNTIRRLDGWWYTNNRRGTVVVTANWGFAAIPDRIIEACKILAKDIIQNREVVFGMVDTAEGSMSPRMNPTVRATITAYRGPRSWPIG